MPRYIDAEALAEEMGAGCIPILEKGISGVTGDETCIMDYINNVPAADVEPVRHGRWIDKCVRDWHCSECNFEIQKIRHYDGYCYKDMPKYCPNCGAKINREEGTP